jgi:hypothetical protein
MHWYGQYISNPQPGMRFHRRLAIDPYRALRHQFRAIRSRAHNPGAPQPLIQPLPVLVFPVGYLAPPILRAANAANGPCATFPDAGASGKTGLRRRSGSSKAGAGGPC